MSRELRQVPPHWDHPVVRVQRWPGMVDAFKPMVTQSLAEAQTEWDAGALQWRAGTHSDLKFYEPEDMEEALGERPSADDEHYVLYRPWDPAEATWFQLWQTVSEGTPVTPPFATKDELVEYLVENGDNAYGPMFDRSGDSPRGWSRRAAEGIVAAGWAPSGLGSGIDFTTSSEEVAERVGTGHGNS